MHISLHNLKLSRFDCMKYAKQYQNYYFPINKFASKPRQGIKQNCITGSIKRANKENGGIEFCMGDEAERNLAHCQM